MKISSITWEGTVYNVKSFEIIGNSINFLLRRNWGCCVSVRKDLSANYVNETIDWDSLHEL